MANTFKRSLMSDSRALVLIEQPKRRYAWATDQEVIEGLLAHAWHIGQTAKFFGVKRRELQARINETPEIQLELQDFKEEVVDNAELRYIAAAEAGKFEAVVGVLNQLGRGRGWGKQDTNLGEGIEVVIRQISQET